MLKSKKILFLLCILYLNFDSLRPMGTNTIGSMGVDLSNQYFTSGSLNMIPSPYFVIGDYHPDAVMTTRPDIWSDPEVRRLGTALLEKLSNWVMQNEVPVYKRRLYEELRNMNSSLMADPTLSALNLKLKTLLTQVENSKEFIKAEQDYLAEKNKAEKQFNIESLKLKLKELQKEYDTSKKVIDAKKQFNQAQRNLKTKSKVEQKEKELQGQITTLRNRYVVDLKLSDLLKQVEKRKSHDQYDPKIVTPKIFEEIKNLENTGAFQKLKLGMVDYSDKINLNYTEKMDLKNAYDDFYLAKSKFDNSLKTDIYMLVINKELFNLKVNEATSDAAIKYTQNKLNEVIESEQNRLEIPKYVKLLKEAKKNVAESANVKKAKENFEKVRKNIESNLGIPLLRTDIAKAENDVTCQYYIADRKKDLEVAAGSDVYKAQVAFDNAVKKALAEENKD